MSAVNPLYSASLGAIDRELDEVSQWLSARSKLGAAVGDALRRAIDSVIDGHGTGRYSITQLEKTEKTYIGTKVEILLRNELKLGRGAILDNLICGHEVDTKFSIRSSWMIPREAFDQLCLLVKADDKKSTFSLGLIRAREENLTVKSNQDKKRRISKHGKANIKWLLHQHSMPENFLLGLDAQVRDLILQQRSGDKRIDQLFLNVTDRLIPRTAILQIAQEADSLNRARKSKARLQSRGRRVLCATYMNDRAQMELLGFNPICRNEWLSIAI